MPIPARAFNNASPPAATACQFEGDAVNTGVSFVGTDKGIGMTEDVRPTDLVVQGMEAAGRFLLGLAIELPL